MLHLLMIIIFTRLNDKLQSTGEFPLSSKIHDHFMNSIRASIINGRIRKYCKGIILRAIRLANINNILQKLIFV